MSLTAYGTGSEETAPDPIDNNDFWPTIDPADFRAA